MTLSVPVFVERLDRRCRGFRESKAARDAGAAFATRCNEFTRDAWLLRNSDEVTHARPHRAAAGHRLPRFVRQPATVVPINRLQSRLHVLVVAAEQRRDARGVRRAARVLEQQRVVQLRQLVAIESRFLAQSHADHAGPHRVALGLPLGHVERVRKRSEHLRQRHASNRRRNFGRGRGFRRVRRLQPARRFLPVLFLALVRRGHDDGRGAASRYGRPVAQEVATRPLRQREKRTPGPLAPGFQLPVNN